jgi:hypothetical protein
MGTVTSRLWGATLVAIPPPEAEILRKLEDVKKGFLRKELKTNHDFATEGWGKFQLR